MSSQKKPFDQSLKMLLEDLFVMGGGYVLDFTNSSFAQFIEDSVSFDPYEKYDGSKAAILRMIWSKEPPDVVAKLNLDLVERWNLIQLRTDAAITDYQKLAVKKAQETFESIGSDHETTTQDDAAFLARDFGEINIDALRTNLTAADIVAARLLEIQKTLDADAPLATIFLVGSTLEGLLHDIAMANTSSFLASRAVPRSKGKTKPLDQWTLDELITVSADIGVLSADVAKHATQVRNFRNYIHPRQQLREQFEPRAETAQIAQQVLRAALKDLEAIRN